MKMYQKNRLKTIIAFFAYLFLNSVMFGAIFSRPVNEKFVVIGIICGMIAQGICLYILKLVYST